MTYHGAHYTTVVGGTGLLAETIAERLGERVITNATVTRVAQDGSMIRVTCVTNGVERVVLAEQCVLAVPAAEMLRLCDGLSEDKARALRALKSVNAISLGLIIEGASEAPWDKMYWLHTGSTIKSLVNDEYFSGRRRPPQERRVFSLIISGEQADEGWGLSDADLTDRVISRLTEIFPEATGHVRVYRIVRHEPAMAIIPPGAEHDLEVRTDSLGRIHFCGADMLGVGTDLAIRTGEEAARRALNASGALA
jgi:monoamine oxidase